jgi:predicted GNAT family acetyltransferase
MDNFEVRMIHKNLAAVPVFACPDPFRFEFYRTGREEDWLEIHKLSDQFNVFTPFVFPDQFGKDIELLKQRQLFLLNADGKTIGTATAWDDFRTKYSGRVHWVALLPEYHGKGLGNSLLSAVCQNLIAAGHEKGCLSTSTARLAAIKLYLKFGFQPLIQSEADQLSWLSFERKTGVPCA